MNLDPTIGVFMDGLIAVLLLATIATGLFLNRRIERLRKSTADMGSMVGGFDKATARARAGIEALRAALRESGQQLQDQINVARDLRDDLRSMGGTGRESDRQILAKGMPPKRAKSMATAEPMGMPGGDDANDDRPTRVAPAKADMKNVARPQFAGRPQGAAVNRKAAAAMTAAATQESSEVERELRELLRHVR
jgi:hypothetical protein